MIVAVGIGYFLVCAAIGWWATRRTRTSEDFFVAGRSVGLLPFAIAAMATTLSGFTFIGGPGLIYTVGVTAIFISLPASLTNTMGAWVLGKRMRLLGEVRGLITVPDAIGARYRSPSAQGISAIAILFGLVGYIATNILALGIVVDSILHVGRGPGIWAGTAVLLAYSAGGGILAGIWTDVLQGALMALTSTIVFAAALDAGGGLTAITHALQAADPAIIGPWGARGAMVALSYFFVFGVGSFGQPHVAHKYYMLKDARRLKWYPLLMTIAMTLALLLFFSVGLSVRAMVARGELPPLGSPDDATPTFLLGHVPRFIAALVFSGVAAAIMSTVNSFLSVGAAAVTHDLPRALGRTAGEDARRLRTGRVWTVVLCLAGAVLAQLSGTLVAFLGIFGYGLFASTLLPALAIGLNWEGATRQGAIASIITGLALTIGLESAAFMKLISLPTGVTVTGLSLVASLLMFVAVSLATRRDAASQIDPDVRAVMEA